MTHEISVIKEFFDSHQVRLSPIWLRDCIKWCKEEALPNNYSIKDLKYKVFEQWLLLDLRDVEVPCLPPGLSTHQKYILNGNYSLQLMKVVDISKPKYWQMQRIRNETSKNLDKDDNVSSKRVLMLTLSDGAQEIEAMEYTPITALNINLTPGIKIRLMGPITVRRGLLMLETQNVKVIGGEVDTLMVSNAAENILAASLNLPLNPNPFSIQESMFTADTDILEKSWNVQLPKLPQNKLITMNQTVIKQLPVQNTVLHHQNDLQNFLQEEELKINEEIDNLMEIEQEFERSRTNKNKSQTPDMFEDMDMDDAILANINIPKTITNNTTSSNFKNRYSKPEDNMDLSRSLDSDNDVFERVDIDVHLNKLNKKIEENGLKQETVDDQPAKMNQSESKLIKIENTEIFTVEEPKIHVWTINKLKQNLHMISNGKFKIRAKFQTVFEKLTLIGGEFHLVISVEDSSGDMTVKVNSEVVALWAGCTPAELNNFKSGVQENVTDAQNNILKALQRLRENVQKLDNIVEIFVNSKESYPVLMKILS